MTQMNQSVSLIIVKFEHKEVKWQYCWCWLIDWFLLDLNIKSIEKLKWLDFVEIANTRPRGESEYKLFLIEIEWDFELNDINIIWPRFGHQINSILDIDSFSSPHYILQALNWLNPQAIASNWLTHWKWLTINRISLKQFSL